jgi:putative membrane protein
MGGLGPFMWLFMGLFWLALIGLIVWLVIRLLPGSADRGHHGAAPAVGETPEQILDRMFALGEIDETTYRTRRGALAEMRKPS